MVKTKNYQDTLSLSSLKNAEKKVSSFLKSLTRFPGFTNLSKILLQDIKLAVMEGVSNAFVHGGASRKKPAQIRLKATPKEIRVEIRDFGPGFNLTSQLRKKPAETSTTGRGLLILKSLTDRIQYRRGRPNCLILTKKLERPKNLDAVMELSQQLQDSLQALRPMEVLYEQFIDFLMNLFNVERGSLMTFDENEGILRIAVSKGIHARVAKKVKIQPGEGVAGFVFQTGRPLLVNNLGSSKGMGWKARQKGYATSNFVSIPVIASPLHIGEEMIGVLNLTDRRDGSRFSQADLKMLELMANQAAGIFRTRQLMDALKEHEAFHRELQIVSEIQERLIPVEFPRVGGIQIGGHCQLSPRGGGDYFDVVQVGKSLRGVIADVSGHNVGSAITMASFRSMVRSLSFDPNTPGEWLRALRWAMHEELLRLHQFISCWVWEFNPPGSFVLSGAGHPPVLIYREKEKNWETLSSHHLPLGLEDDSRLQNLKVQLKKGDIIIFYTDGLFDPRMRETGLERDNIMAFMEKNLRFTPQKMIENLFGMLDSHLNLLKAPDDVAVLALKRR